MRSTFRLRYNAKKQKTEIARKMIKKSLSLVSLLVFLLLLPLLVFAFGDVFGYVAAYVAAVTFVLLVAAALQAASFIFKFKISRLKRNIQNARQNSKSPLRITPPPPTPLTSFPFHLTQSSKSMEREYVRGKKPKDTSESYFLRFVLICTTSASVLNLHRRRKCATRIGVHKKMDIDDFQRGNSAVAKQRQPSGGGFGGNHMQIVRG